MKKNTMKKLLAASLSLSLALSLAACSGGSSSFRLQLRRLLQQRGRGRL